MKTAIGHRAIGFHIPRLLSFVATIFLMTVGIVQAQPSTKLPRIGFLSGGGDAKNALPNLQSFREGLRDLGYVEGKNILIEERYIKNSVDEFSDIVIELLRLKVDVLVIEPLIAIQAAKKATQSIPIVMVTSVDPVATGLVQSLARPGGNITGFATLSRELSGKRLELLKELVPPMSNIGVLEDVNAPVSAITLKEYEAVARGLKIQIQSLEVRGPTPDLEGTFRAALKSRINALVTISNPMLGRYRKQIADLAIKSRLPSTADGSGFIEAGFLMSYSANKSDQYRRAAVYVVKILKGAKPSDLPVERPTKFEFVINLQTAKQIGLTIPPNVLVRADRVIK